jgi:hypothetical protein
MATHPSTTETTTTTTPPATASPSTMPATPLTASGEPDFAAIREQMSSVPSPESQARPFAQGYAERLPEQPETGLLPDPGGLVSGAMKVSDQFPEFPLGGAIRLLSSLTNRGRAAVGAGAESTLGPALSDYISPRTAGDVAQHLYDMAPYVVGGLAGARELYQAGVLGGDAAALQKWQEATDRMEQFRADQAAREAGVTGRYNAQMTNVDRIGQAGRFQRATGYTTTPKLLQSPAVPPEPTPPTPQTQSLAESPRPDMSFPRYLARTAAGTPRTLAGRALGTGGTIGLYELVRHLFR